MKKKNKETKYIGVVLSRTYNYEVSELDGSNLQEKISDAEEKAFLDFKEELVYSRLNIDRYNFSVKIKK